MKLLVLLPLTLPRISVSLIQFGHALLEYLSPPAQVIFVMAIFPLVMTVLQFCLVDQVIKAGKEQEKAGDEEEGGYRRVPTRETEVDATPRGLTVKEARRRGSTVKSRAGSPSIPTPTMPSSPLLSPAEGEGRQDYGSATPSPGTNFGNKRSGIFWERLLGQDLGEADNVDDGLNGRSADSSIFDGEETLKRRHYKRSGAPSPDSQRGANEDTAQLDTSKDLSPVLVDPPTTAFSTNSRLSDDLRQQASRNLSPSATRHLTVSHEQDEQWGLSDVKR